MALFNFNPSSAGESLGARAMGALMDKASASLNSRLVRDAQNLISKSSMIGNLLGLDTGSGALNSFLGLGSSNQANEMLGGLTMAQAKAIYRQADQLSRARKNLFFVRIYDDNPPQINYGIAEGTTIGSSLMQQGVSRLGAAAGSLTSGLSAGISSITNNTVGNAAQGLMNGFVSGLGLGGDAGSEVSIAARDCLDLLCIDVQYSQSINGDSVSLGGTFFDAPTGVAPAEVTLITMDDEAGTIKRWFEGKRRQVVKPDGTVGLPAEYSLGLEVYHAIPAPEAQGYAGAFHQYFNLRASSVSGDLSRRASELEELPLVFTQIDPFMDY